MCDMILNYVKIGMRAFVLRRVRLLATPCPVHGIFQARILEWVAVSFSRNLPDPGPELTSPALVGRFFFLPLSHQGSHRHRFLRKLEGSTPDAKCGGARLERRKESDLFSLLIFVFSNRF